MTPATAPVTPLLDVDHVRSQFPILGTTAHGKPLVYLDSAATTQKPRSVIDRLSRYYERENANIHRGVYALSAEATAMHDAARARVARFIGASSEREVLFTRGTTEGVNLVAQAWGHATLRTGDEIVVTAMEHHSNIVPWQLVAAQRGAVVRAAPVTEAGELDLEGLGRLLSRRTRMVAVVHLSNALGTINPVQRVAEMAHAAGALVLVDGAQSAAHLPIDVQAIGCDFFAFSGHKLFGPTGIGVLWGREALLDRMPPWQGGGDMIGTVSVEGSTWAPLPAKFEAGTPHIAGAVGLHAAIDFVSSLDAAALAAHEHDLLAYATERMSRVPGVRLVGTAREKASVLSFTLDGVHPHDLGTVLDAEGVCIRAGHHCAQPLMRRLGLVATARASFSVYNTRDDVDALVGAVEQARRMLA
ncbi:MAG: cysteine desulfurase [Gemmatimonadales bacterium]|nr:cysteine desulfurase [Gemmatimonadales bacterium]